MKKPVYKLIEETIKKRIENGTLKNGDMIESENELTEVYNVSRMTVRLALNNLVNEGYLYKHKGKGTFVNYTKLEKRLDNITGFTEQMNQSDMTASSKILSIEVIKATELISKKLLIDSEEEVYKVERIRYGDNIPICYEIVYLPKTIFPSVEEKIFAGSFYEYVEKNIAKITYCTQKIEARQAGENYAKYLEIDAEMPLLYVSVVSNLDNGRPFEYTRCFYRGDQYCLIRRALR